MESNREIANNYGEPESTRLKTDLRAYLAPQVGDVAVDEQILKVREHAQQSLSVALTDMSTNSWTAYEMIAEYSTLAKQRPQGEVLYAYYALVKKIVDENPDAPVPSGLLSFIEEQATDLEEFSVVVEIGMMNINSLTAERTTSPLEQFTAHVAHKQREFDAYVTRVTSELYQRHGEAVAEFSNFSGESYAREKELMDKYKNNPERLRNAIIADQIRTDQGLKTARLQHDCHLLTNHSGQMTDLHGDIKERTTLTSEGRVAIIAQYEHGLINVHAAEPERFKALFNRDLKTVAAKAYAAARYDQHLIESSGDIQTLLSHWENHRFLSKQGKEAAKRIISE